MNLIKLLVNLILEKEDNPLRFEEFCVDIYKAMKSFFMNMIFISGDSVLSFSSRTFGASREAMLAASNPERSFCVLFVKGRVNRVLLQG